MILLTSKPTGSNPINPKLRPENKAERKIRIRINDHCNQGSIAI